MTSSVFTPGGSDGLADERGEDFAGREVVERMQEIGRLVSIGELTSGVAHEINNPLSIVAGFAELMMDYALPHPFEDYVQKIYAESHRAARIVQNLLEYSRKCETQKEFKSIQQVIKRALEMKQHDFKLKNIEIVTDWPRNLPRTMIYERQITQAVLNVLTNAEQALANYHGSGRITISACSSAGNVIIKIADNGPGISRNHIERIFAPFFTTKGSQEGTGLGLSECHRIVKLHGGQIWVQSHLRQGSTFCIQIPVLRPEPCYKTCE